VKLDKYTILFNFEMLGRMRSGSASRNSWGCSLHITFRPKSAGATWHVIRKLTREVGGLSEEVEEGAQEVEANEISDKRPVEGDDPKEDDPSASQRKM
jgi:hypothetical protein